MQAVAERIKQALDLGPDAFLPSSLEAQEATVKELDVFVDPLKRLLKAAQQFAEDTKKFLDANGTYVTEAPFPHIWMQGSPTERATIVPTTVLEEHAHLYDAGVASVEAGAVPGAVDYALQRELISPLQQWLWAYQLAQGELSELQGKRLSYDAERRSLVKRATRTTEASVQGGSRGEGITQLAEDAAAVTPLLAEFESDVETLDDLLRWLVAGAARIKALLADTCGSVAVAVEGWDVPQGLMPPFPEKSSFGPDVEVSVTWSDTAAPSDQDKGLAASATDLTASHTSGITTVKAVHGKDVVVGAPSGGGGAGGGEPPDLSSMLPSDDAKVYGGGVAPSPREGIAEPSGGGPAQLFKDTFAPTAPAAAGQQEASPGDGSITSTGSLTSTDSSMGAVVGTPDLSPALPADEAMVFGGGVAPAPRPEGAQPSGGGVGQLIKDTLVAPSGDLEPPDDTELPAAPELRVRSAHSYTGEGVGRVEARMADEASGGLGLGQRRLGRARSAGAEASAEHLKGAETQVAVGAEDKQVSTMVLPPGSSPTSPPVQPSTAAAPAAPISTSSPATPSSLVTAAAAAAHATTTPSPAEAAGTAVHRLPSGHEDADIAGWQSQRPEASGGGVLAAIRRTVAEEAVGATPEAGPAQAESQATSATPGPTISPAAGDAVWFKGPTPPGGAAAATTATDGGTSGAAREAAAAGGGSKGEGLEDVSGQGSMHIGPVAPEPGSSPAPGSAHFVKGPAPPGAAAAATEGVGTGIGSDVVGAASGAESLKDSSSKTQSSMHIGPVAPEPGSIPAPGSAHFVKGPTPPGGAVAGPGEADKSTGFVTSSSITAAGSNSSEKGQAAAPGIGGESKTAAAAAEAPAGAEEGVPAGGSSAPSGGSVGKFIKDKLFGSSS